MAWICHQCLAVHDEEPKVFIFGDLILEPNGHLTCNDISVKLTKREAEIMTDFMNGKPISKEAIMMRHFDEERSDKGTDVYVSKIRKKLEPLNTTCRIDTLWGPSYQLKKPQDVAGVITFGDLKLDIERRALFSGDKTVTLRPQTVSLLQDLMSRTFVSDDTLVRYIVRGDEPTKVKHVRVQITYIRRAFRELGSRVNIVTVKKALSAKPGYWLKDGVIANVSPSSGPVKIGLGPRQHPASV